MSIASLHTAAAGVVNAGQGLSAATDTDDVAALADGLDALASSLHGAAHACDRALSASVPQAMSRGSICARYREAREQWPTSTPPSNERLAAVLASVHDAVRALRTAADHCAQARHAVDAARNAAKS
jgi:hypothetical protein